MLGAALLAADSRGTDRDSPGASIRQPSSAPTAAHVWRIAFDGVIFGTFTHASGRRGGTEFRSQNWFMAEASRPVGRSTFGVTGMLTMEPATVGRGGYLEIFQEGESYRGLQITDRQHPHDLFMQLVASWRVPIGDRTSVTVVGGPVGEAALGPVPFMHRASSADNPTAPLSHHIFDSTHLSTGVVLARVDRGPLAIEGSVFHAREPDEDRIDIDTGALDSWSARAWLRIGSAWTLQASHGFLHEPERLEPGDQRRTNGSVSWMQTRDSGFTAATVALGRVERPYSLVWALLAEGEQRFGRSSVYGRFERVSVETEILLFPQIVHRPHPGELVDPIRTLTVGGVRDIARPGPLALGIGADVTVYGVPPLLQITHGEHPASFHVFVRLSRAEGRMWNMTMAAPGAPGHRHH